MYIFLCFKYLIFEIKKERKKFCPGFYKTDNTNRDFLIGFIVLRNYHTTHLFSEEGIIILTNKENASCTELYISVRRILTTNPFAKFSTNSILLL